MMQVDVVNNLTVAYVGTNDSRILKLVVDKPRSAVQYGVVLLDPDVDLRLVLPVKTLILDKMRANSSADNTFIYALTEKSV